MKKYQNAKTSGLKRLLLFLTICACLLPIGIAYGEKTAKPSQELRHCTPPSTQPTADTITITYPLKFSNASTVYNVIFQSLRNAVANSPFYVTYDSTKNVIFVTATKEIQQRAAKMIAEAEEKTKDQANVTQIYKLKHATPDSVAHALNKILKGRITICEPWGTNQILVAGAIAGPSGPRKG